MTRRALVYAPRYFRRLGDIYERIAADNTAAAARTVDRIRAAVSRLATFPAMGRPGRVERTRELVIPGTPYIVPYRVEPNAVFILSIQHGAQEWPDRFC